MVKKEFQAVTTKLLSKATDEQLRAMRSILGRAMEDRLVKAEKKYFVKSAIGARW